MMESVILETLKRDFATTTAQRTRLIELVNQFGSLEENTIKFVVGDVLCLLKLLYESGDKSIVLSTRKQILDLEIMHSEDSLYREKLEYLNKCLTSFKPAIFRSIQLYFSEIYHFDPKLIVCLPKIVGQQVGTKVEIKKMPEDKNPILFHVKTHYEFCSKSHPQLLVITSDGTGKINFKELFMYKVLEYIGYGPKTHFIIDRDITKSRIEEGIFIATQDLGYTKKPDQKQKSFKSFKEIGKKLNNTIIENVDEQTKRDIIAIDMLSRAFLLEDVLINQGNFGVTTSSNLFEPCVLSTKWKIIDFIPPILRHEIGDDYNYSRHYPGGVNIFHSFRIGNASHAYNREGLEIINRILLEKYARDFWLPAISKLSYGTQQHLPVAEALEKAFEYIRIFMIENTGILQIKPDRMERRMTDLQSYKSKVMQNFTALEQGIREYLNVQEENTTLEKKTDQISKPLVP